MLKMAGASGVAAIGSTGLASAQRKKTNRVQLIEAGLTFEPEDDLEIKHRMPVDILPKYRLAGNAIMPTRFAPS